MTDIIERLRKRYPQLEIDTDRLSEGWEAAEEIKRLRATIRWALGEAPNTEGKWFDEAKPHPYPKYWWRTELRRALEPKT